MKVSQRRINLITAHFYPQNIKVKVNYKKIWNKNTENTQAKQNKEAS